MIHPQAIVDPKARVDEDVEVGAFSIIGADVEIGAGTWIGPHVVIQGPTRIGSHNEIYQFATVGEAPQDKGYKGEPTRLEIGDNNVIREYATLHRATTEDDGVTRVGDKNYFMAYTHIAHDCSIGDRTVFANCASLGGHVRVDDDAILAGFAIVHQYCRIGAHSFCGMGAAINRDVPPYVIAAGHMARPHGINVEGLKRRGFSLQQVRNLRRAYRILYKSGYKLEAAVAELESLGRDEPEVAVLAKFLGETKRSIIR